MMASRQLESGTCCFVMSHRGGQGMRGRQVGRLHTNDVSDGGLLRLAQIHSGVLLGINHRVLHTRCLCLVIPYIGRGNASARLSHDFQHSCL